MRQLEFPGLLEPKRPSVLDQVEDLLAGHKSKRSGPHVHIMTNEGRMACNRKRVPKRYVTLAEIAEGTHRRITCSKCPETNIGRKAVGWYRGADDPAHAYRGID